jgi:predicted Rossmann fold nucleotide-binding protein DprA/Smf involved in DNA uptake
MNVAIIGSRGFSDWDRFAAEVDRFLLGTSADVIISGGAEGADTLAERYAQTRGIPIQVFPADWDRFGTKAGPNRNRQIVAACDVLIAFWDGTSHGTRKTVQLAQNAGKTVFVVKVTP